MAIKCYAFWTMTRIYIRNQLQFYRTTNKTEYTFEFKPKQEYKAIQRNLIASTKQSSIW